MSAARVAVWMGAGLVAGSLAFLVTGTFHWAYLVVLASLLWLTARASGQPSRAASAPVPADRGARAGAIDRNGSGDGLSRCAPLAPSGSSPSPH